MKTSGHFVGMDVGGTKVAAATLEDGRLSEAEMLPTDLSGTETVLDQLAATIERHRRPDTRAVGIGVPSVIEFATGLVRHSVNLPLQNVPLRSILTERAGLPVYVENDASCAAMAEAHDDRGTLVTPNLVMFTVGTGVGGGLVLNGRLYRGATGAAAEVGHTMIGLDLEEGDTADPGDFPQRGSLEALAAGRALDRLAARAAANNPLSALGRRLVLGEPVNGTVVVDLAREGDELACDLLRILGERLGVGIANAINPFDPAEVVIGGGVSRAGELLRGPAERAARRHIVPGVGTDTAIRLARHGVEAGVFGAALIAAEEHALEHAAVPGSS
jgi:glucokinase